MSTSKYIDKISCIVMALTLIITLVSASFYQNASESTGINMEYEAKLFDNGKVHEINIVMDDWDDFIKNCEDEEYKECSVVIDNETYKKVAIRAKGNTSLSQVSTYGNNRYSFKIEFDHYEDKNSYYGLDKLCLNNIIQDNTYMKDYLTYQMMKSCGVDTPLCSFTYIKVNGQDWGLYLAIEGVEESFLERNYGKDYGNLYKPDSQGSGGMGKENNNNGQNMQPPQQPQNGDTPSGNGQNNNGQNMQPPQQPQNGDVQNVNVQNVNEQNSDRTTDEHAQNGGMAPGNMQGGNMAQGGMQEGNMPQGGMQEGNMPQDGMQGGGMAADDVCLKYTDDEISSYSNIFDNAKTDVSKSDKKRLINSLKQLNNNENLDEVVNMDEVIRYFVVHNFVCNFDSYTGSMIHNYYLYEKNGQMSMIPWDYNLAFGTFQGASDATSLVNYPIDTPVSGKSVEERPMLAWIFSSQEYQEEYHKAFLNFINSYFDNGVFETEIEKVTQMISPYVEKDPTKFCTYEEFQKGVSALKEFCTLRAESVKKQIQGEIPATSDGQKEDKDNLIDASSITISDLGSMGMGRGGNIDKAREQNPANSQETNTENQTATGQTNEQSQENQNNSNDNQNNNLIMWV